MHGVRNDPSIPVKYEPSQKPAVPRSGQELLVAVVPGKDHDRVLAEAEFVELVEEHAEVAIELEQTVGPIAVSARALVLVARMDRQVHQRIVVVDEERLVSLGVAFEEVERPSVHLDIDIDLEITVEDTQLFDRFALLALIHVLDGVALGVVPRVVGPQGRIPRERRAVPLVEAVIGRPTPVALADVPLAHAQRGVAGLREEVAHRLLPGNEATGHTRRRGLGVARANRIAARHERRAGRAALRLRGVVHHLEAVSGELIDPLGIRAAQDATAVTPKLAVAQVVDVEDQDIGSTRSHECLSCLLLLLRSWRTTSSARAGWVARSCRSTAPAVRTHAGG